MFKKTNKYHSFDIISQKPGLVLDWQIRSGTFCASLFTSILSGFSEWIELDQISFQIPPTLTKEQVLVFSLEYFSYGFGKLYRLLFFDSVRVRDDFQPCFSINNLIVIAIGRALLFFSLFNSNSAKTSQTAAHANFKITAVSTTGCVLLDAVFVTPNSNKRPSFVAKFGLKHILVICGKSVLLVGRGI